MLSIFDCIVLRIESNMQFERYSKYSIYQTWSENILQRRYLNLYVLEQVAKCYGINWQIESWKIGEYYTIS